MPVRRVDPNSYTLAANASATGAAVAIPGGEYCFVVSGNAGGATLSLQTQTPNSAWVDVQIFTGSIVKFTTLPGSQTGISLPAGNVRLAATGGAPTGINSSLLGIG